MSLSGRERAHLDRLLVTLVRGLCVFARLPSPLVRGGLRVAMTIAVTASWPLLPHRRRMRTAGCRFAPWRWAWNLGGNLASLLGRAPHLHTSGLPPAGQSSGLLLAAHCGPWEAGAAELARSGLRPLVIAAPWPRLPRTEALVRDLRGASGVHSLPRGRETLKIATRHLKAGGWVVVLVDSLHPNRTGRRPVAFVDEPVGAPDGLVAWSARHGAALYVATSAGDTFTVERLRSAGTAVRLTRSETESLADRVVQHLARAAQARPWEWAWVRALAVCALTVLPFGCAPAPGLPPLPVNHEAWRADMTDLHWEGAVDHGPLSFDARVARVRLVEEQWAGGFEEVRLVWSGERRVEVHGVTARGTFPGGPLTIRDVRYSIDELDGAADNLTWRGGRRLTCGGCPLETLAERLPEAP